ncbi:hypothetical protein Thein_1432 [Thermodesulfatator indicus DSM 15286]|uniref:L-2-amino-thiazoline-4-carboxylic acid hydrolase n=1 Tax=Thermodesulfatator indicus (strain DSM 15286 / JCM 11887 / CIR29812) TaxID=667014 RepID=F8AA11_THEID|nr:L-2-amino-thiazoline-4-carboxylic acid hydrolase [Thermodesulfatator indicus]AEH45297.1 hypothetical protein Thein_1432 [Thermodesulfatator indicus DSM 15286]
MRIQDLKIIQSVLSREVGPSWLWLVFKATLKQNAILKQTRWAGRSDEETQFVKQLPIIVALYQELQKRNGKDKAYEIIKKLLIPLGCAEQKSYLEKLDLTGKTPMEKILAFNDIMEKEGALKINTFEYLTKSKDKCHFIIKRCIFHEFFTEVGTPELTKIFCEIDRAFLSEAFPEIKFHRGDSWENTIAFGKKHCDFIFEEK